MEKETWKYKHTCSLCGEVFFQDKVPPGYLGAIGRSEKSKYFYDIKLYKWCRSCWVKADCSPEKIKRKIWFLRNAKEKKREYQRNYMRFRVGFRGDFEKYKAYRREIFQKMYLKIMGITLGSSFGPYSNL